MLFSSHLQQLMVLGNAAAVLGAAFSLSHTELARQAVRAVEF